MKNKKTVILLLIFLLAVVVRIAPLDTSYFFWDETIYLMHAEDFKYGSAAYTEHDIRPPLVPFLLSYLPPAENLYRIFMALANSLLVILAYFFGREINTKAGLIAAFFAALLPFHIITSSWVMTDTLATLFISAALFFYWKGLKSGKTLALYLGGAFFWLSLLTKFTSLIFLPIFLLLLIIFRKKSRIHYYLSIVVTAIVTLPYLIFNYNLFGNIVQPIISAFFVVQESDPAGLYFTLFSLVDFFGILLLLFILSTKQISNKYSLFLLGWAGITIAYYLFILQRGVVKPPTLEWEAERFLLPAIMPVIILASSFVSKLKKKAVITVVIIFLLLNLFYIDRITTPAIEYENGLRSVSKEMGLYIKSTIPQETIYCMGNCPVLAYYSHHKTVIAAYHDFANHVEEVPEDAYLAVLTKANEEEFDLEKIKTIESGEWKETLYRVN